MLLLFLSLDAAWTAEDPAADEVPSFEEMEEDALIVRRSAARIPVEVGGYTAMDFHVVHDAEAIVTTMGFAPERVGAVLDFQPARPVTGAVHVGWTPESGFDMVEAYGSFALFSRRVLLRGGRWLAPIGLFNAERLQPQDRIVPELPAGASLFLGTPFSVDGVSASTELALGPTRLDAALWVVNAPNVIPDSVAGASTRLAPAPYDGASTPLQLGARLDFTPLDGVRLGLSTQRGRFESDPLASQRLYGVDARYAGERLRADTELLVEQSRIQADFGPLTVTHTTFVAGAGFGVTPWLEPVAQLDLARITAESFVGGVRVSGGVNLRPFPARAPDAVLALAYTHHVDALGYWRDSRAIARLAVGF